MIYCIDPTADEPIFLINKHIGYDKDDGMGIDGSIFQQELLQMDSLGKKRIQELFYPLTCEFHSVTLAPPIARPLASFPTLTGIIETACPFLRTHIIADIRK